MDKNFYNKVMTERGNNCRFEKNITEIIAAY